VTFGHLEELPPAQFRQKSYILRHSTSPSIFYPAWFSVIWLDYFFTIKDKKWEMADFTLDAESTVKSFSG